MADRHEQLIDTAAKAIANARRVQCGLKVKADIQELMDPAFDLIRDEVSIAFTVFGEANTSTGHHVDHHVDAPTDDVLDLLLDAEGWPVPTVVDVVMKRWSNDNHTIRSNEGGWAWRSLASSAIQSLAQAGLLQRTVQGEPSDGLLVQLEQALSRLSFFQPWRVSPEQIVGLHKVLASAERIAKDAAAEGSETSALIECPHWASGRITLRKGCTACEATAAGSAVDDAKGPHSRACGFDMHEHGAACSRDCPTCHGAVRAERPGDGSSDG